MAKWNLDTIEADMAEIREAVDKLQEINRLQAQTIERQAFELNMFRNAGVIEVAVRNSSVSDYMEHWEGRAEKAEAECEALREQLRQAQQSLRNARDSALEEAAKIVEQHGGQCRLVIYSLGNTPAINASAAAADGACKVAANEIRSLKSTTQGSRE